jgi:hypothetical protein
MTKRDERGRFVKGETGNPNGRPKRVTETEYLDATVESVSILDWREIVVKAREDAKGGDAVARKWLSDYLIGKPPDTVRVSGNDNAPIPIEFNYAAAIASITPRSTENS